MNLILFGAPGAGKGTQSALLIDRKKMYQISTGDLFRAAISNKTNLGMEAKTFMDKGELVPDRIVIGMVEELFKKGVKNFILDGFPRTLAQAEALEDLLKRSDLKVDKAIFLDVPYSVLLSRLTGRRVCQKCGAVYHIESKPTKDEGVCDNCGGQVIQRQDDKAEVIGTRLKAYESSTAPLREYYRKLNKYVELDGNRESELVYNDIVKFLN